MPVPVPSLLRPAQKKPFYAMPAFIIAMLCFVASAGFFAHTQHRLATWESAEGVVVANEAKQSSSRRGGKKTKYYARVRFTAADGQVYRVEQQSGSASPDFELGAKVSVHYPAAAPGEGMIDSPWELYRWCGIFAFMGLAMMIAALLKRVWGKG